MVKKISPGQFLPVIFTFYVMGFVDVVGLATGYVKQDFELSNSAAQILSFMVFIWFALLAIPTGVFQDNKGKRLTVNIGMVLTGIGMLIPFFFYSLPTSIVGFAVLGIGNTVLQVSANPLLLDISSNETKAANLSLSQFVKAIASMLGPVIAAALVLYTGNWRYIFPVYAAISFIAALWLGSVKIEESKPEKARATISSVFSLLKNPYIVVMVFAVFFIVGFDVTMNTSIAGFLVSRFTISIETASLGISIYFASLMAGRFAGAFLLRKVNAKIFLVISTLLTLAGLVGLIFSHDLLLARIMIFVAGLGFSNIFPIMFAIIVDRKPDYANELSGLIILAVCGGAVIPPISGIVSDMYGAVAGIFILLACIAYVAYATVYVLKK